MSLVIFREGIKELEGELDKVASGKVQIDGEYLTEVKSKLKSFISQIKGNYALAIYDKRVNLGYFHAYLDDQSMVNCSSYQAKSKEEWFWDVHKNTKHQSMTLDEFFDRFVVSAEDVKIVYETLKWNGSTITRAQS